MKKVLVLLAIAMLAFASGSACFPIGFVFSTVKHPGLYTSGETTNPGSTPISGHACAQSILGLVAIGDWSLDAALKDAGAEGKTLKNVAVDYQALTVLTVVYGKFCTTVSAVIAE